MKLDGKYQHTRSNILMMKEMPSAADAYSILTQEQTHQAFSRTIVVGESENQEPSIACRIEKRKFTVNKRRNDSKSKRQTLYCDHCKIHGHTMDRCWKINGYPDNNTNTPNSVHFAGMYGLFSNKLSTWIIDSDASDHICFDKSLFDSLKPLKGKSHLITIPNGKHVRVEYIGSVILGGKLVLSNVLYAPGFHFNLISVHKLAEELQCKIVFGSNNCYVQGTLRRNPLLFGEMPNGLYQVKLKTPTVTQNQQIGALTVVQPSEQSL